MKQSLLNRKLYIDVLWQHARRTRIVSVCELYWLSVLLQIHISDTEKLKGPQIWFSFLETVTRCEFKFQIHQKGRREKHPFQMWLCFKLLYVLTPKVRVLTEWWAVGALCSPGTALSCFTSWSALTIVLKQSHILCFKNIYGSIPCLGLSWMQRLSKDHTMFSWSFGRGISWYCNQ